MDDGGGGRPAVERHDADWPRRTVWTHAVAVGDERIEAGQQPAVSGWHGGPFEGGKVGRPQPATPSRRPEGGCGDPWMTPRP